MLTLAFLLTIFLGPDYGEMKSHAHVVVNNFFWVIRLVVLNFCSASAYSAHYWFDLCLRSSFCNFSTALPQYLMNASWINTNATFTTNPRNYNLDPLLCGQHQDHKPTTHAHKAITRFNSDVSLINRIPHSFPMAVLAEVPSSDLHNPITLQSMASLPLRWWDPWIHPSLRQQD